MAAAAPARPATLGVLPGTLLQPDAGLPPGCTDSGDAGDYPCNFVYWRALADLPDTRSAFVDVALADLRPEDEQVQAVRGLLGSGGGGGGVTLPPGGL